MGEADKYRSSAQFCMDMAEKATRTADRDGWLRIAQAWLEMIPTRQRMETDSFEAAMRNRSTGQAPSTAKH